jgi:hypothetical protein
MMKKTNAFLLSLAILLSGTTTSCYNSTSYMGTIAGAQLGSTIGSAVGWLGGAGSRGNGAAIGTLVGTVGGAAVGAAIANKAAKRARSTESIDPQYGYGSNEWKSETSRVYGKNDYRHIYHGNATNSSLYISNLTFQDENGDGKLNKEETIVVSYTVQNTGTSAAQVELAVIEPNYYKDLEISKPNVVTIAPNETMRYKSKVYCKHNLSKKTIELQAHARSQEAGDVYEVLRVNCAK